MEEQEALGHLQLTPEQLQAIDRVIYSLIDIYYLFS